MQVTNHGLVIRPPCLLRRMASVLQAAPAICRAAAFAALGCVAGLQAGFGQDLSVQAKLDVASSSFAKQGADITIGLGLSQTVPWRARLLADPPRLILDFREVDFSAISMIPIETARIKGVRAGVFRPGWSRLVLELDGPYLIDEAEMRTTDDKVAVTVRLTPAATEVFLQAAVQPEPAEWQLPMPSALPRQPDRKTGSMVIVLDPGHGGIDPGAERNGLTEADLMLGFARQLKELLAREGIFDIVLTRDDDVFVPLETRISIARARNADLLISLHADALEQGEAVGAVIYTLSAEASEAAAAALAERHDRDDLLAGVDLVGQDDLVATVLMDMARTETAPRTARLAKALEQAMTSSDLKMHRVPLQSAGFSVLKSPDIPSVLIELGFMSSARDFARLTDKAWRATMAGAIRDGVMIWAQEDAALQALRRR